MVCERTGLETPKAEAPKRTRAASSRRTSSSVNDKSINLQTDAENSITSPKALELFHEVIGSARRRVQTAKGGTPGAAVASPLLSPRRALGDVTNATTPAKTEVIEPDDIYFVDIFTSPACRLQTPENELSHCACTVVQVHKSIYPIQVQKKTSSKKF